MPVLLDEPIHAEIGRTGYPVAIIWRGDRFVVTVLRIWESSVYRIATTLSGSPVIGEIACGKTGWRLRRWWT